ncbi:MAG TPA: hypothetical protein VLT59_00980 [Steroidobacteraceae bacterium]|nr:hypothetical protein [Steroidobacteraceae bacterium]
MATILNRARFIVSRAIGNETTPAAPTTKPAKAPRKSYHAVEIVAGDDCCELVSRYTGKRYLSSEAPVVPLKGCDAGECLCRYIHHADRRRRERRTSDVAVTVDEYAGQERRQGKKRGRRATD